MGDAEDYDFATRPGGGAEALRPWQGRTVERPGVTPRAGKRARHNFAAGEVEANTEADEAIELARAYSHERETRLGIVSRALLASHSEPDACSRVAEGGWVCPAQLELEKLQDDRRHGVLVDRPTWLADTRRMQTEVFEVSPAGVAYTKEQGFAAMIEAAELIQTLPWKSVRDGKGDGPAVLTTEQREAARKELLDLLTFGANIAVALEFTDDDLWPALNDIAMRNARRRQGLGKEVWT